MLESYRANRSTDWKWFENALAYSNARLPQALIRAGMRSANDAMVSAGLEALDWLANSSALRRQRATSCRSDHTASTRRKRKRLASTSNRSKPVRPFQRAWKPTARRRESRWRKEAWTAFNWFLGDNDLQIALYDPRTGGCRDGLHPDRANENQGAESTLSFLMALLEMRKFEESPRDGQQVLTSAHPSSCPLGLRKSSRFLLSTCS